MYTISKSIPDRCPRTKTILFAVMCVLDSVSYSLILVSLRSWKWISFNILLETKRGRLDMSCSVGLALLHFYFYFFVFVFVLGIQDHEIEYYRCEEERFFGD